MASSENICDLCGSNKFTLIEGFFYCDSCGIQSQVLLETEHELTLLHHGHRISTSKQADKKSIRDQKAQKKLDGFVQDTYEFDPFDRSIYNKDFPKHLYSIGYRLTTFTKLVANVSHTLMVEFGVHKQVSHYAMWILQKYLQKYRVAFTPDELSKSKKDEFTPSIIRKGFYVPNQNQKLMSIDSFKNLCFIINRLAQESDRLESSQKSRKKRVSLWDELTQEAEDPDFDHANREKVQREKIESTTKLSTGISSDSIRAAAIIYLDIDLILCIVYISALMSGCKWIQISDLFRFNQLLNHCASFHFLTKSQVLFRMLYNVNLPRLFLRQLNHLIQCLPSVNVETGFDLFSNILPVNPNFLDIICTENRIIGSKSYFEEAFIEETDFMNSSSGKKLLISSEAKAAALILFALKLYFGLDDKREFSMDCIEKPSNNNLTPFDFRCWFIQLKLRMFVWQGRPIQSVLSKSFCAEQPPYERQEASRQRLSKFNIPLYPRDCKFSGCVPNIVKNDDFKYHFNNAFIDSTKASESCSTKSNMALYAPLQHIRKTFVVDDDDGIDQHNFEAFYADFYNNSPSFSKEFSELFPCARRYLRTPQENQRCCVIRRSSLLKNTMFDYAEPVLLEHFIWLLFSAATKRFLSSTFQSLLRHFALIISETEYLLYFTFLLVEALILEQTKMVKLEENLRAGHEETFHSGRSQYRLKLSDETKDGPCHRFKYIIFKKLTPKIVYDEDLMSNSDDERTEEPQQNAKFHGERRTMSESSASLSSASSQSSSKLAPSSVSSDSSGISDSEDENRIGSGADTAPESPQAGASDVRPKAQIKERPGRGVSLPSILAMRLISFRFW